MIHELTVGPETDPGPYMLAIREVDIIPPCDSCGAAGDDDHGDYLLGCPECGAEILDDKETA